MINSNKKTLPSFEAQLLAPPAGKALAGSQAVPSKESLQLTLMDSLAVQQLLQICRSSLYNWRKKGLLAFSKVGGRIYFEAADVYRMLQERKQQKWRPVASPVR
ncbi:MAG: hypothetical protein JWR61_754 [Ferruginibacter sp.]|uniref:helix-turn-helix domain-containing protein n=1 Tax=Ferruginibacter sp. TaxID=1940288 RepID=UPI002657ECBC|nr:helix-turn-helix domain-containing protein [Ferruginibacter sp.]MDB5275799.1 hypothetical protein [Ferruginibacter sp.]